MCTSLFRKYKNSRQQLPDAYYQSDKAQTSNYDRHILEAMAAAYHVHRPQLRRNSPLSMFNQSSGFAADAPMIQRIDVGDSSDDDEIPQPMKFSALTKALLESEAPEELASSPKQDGYRYGGEKDQKAFGSIGTEGRRDRYRLDTPSRAPLMKIVRQPTPHALGDEGGYHESPRVVQLGNRSGSIHRTVSITRSREGTPSREYVTPAPASRAVRIARNRSGSNASAATSGAASVSRPDSINAMRSGEQNHMVHDVSHTFNRSASAASGSEAATRHGLSTLARSRNGTGDAVPPASSMRVKRAAVGAGSFLRGAPMRRGFKRRDSDENPSPNDEQQSFSQSVASHGNDEDAEVAPAHVRSRPGSVNESIIAEPVSTHDFASRDRHERPQSRQSNDGLPSIPARSFARPASRKTSTESLSKQHSIDRAPPRVDSAQSRSKAATARRPSRDDLRIHTGAEQPERERKASISQPSYKPPPRRIYTDATDDQENMPPPTFKRNKDHDFKILGKSEKISVLDTDKHRSVADTPVPVPAYQSPRKALGTLNANTPQRQAPPPPPKMSVLDAATKTAGASTTKSKKRRQHILVNGKLFTQMNKLGKGGSSDVYCVMAENFKLFALKKVKLEDCDETAVRGYKGEIDLLQKLKDVDRVVRLYDWELDDSKQTLCVLMEKGDNDLSRVLTQSMSSSNPKFDSVATRFYWKEMLECVQSVHAHDIVHSDLKPANFLMVSGQLKLIDFGIANAIDIDNTVNVHRDSHIGTPNYMSPESITDTNAPVPGAERTTTTATGRVMKLGKPSDVWSLGCILYQMTYGRPPFAHIANQISRVMAITNPAVHISFPSTGIGGVPVPASLRGTLRRCLQRNAALRPSVAQLLSGADPWLYPEANGQVAMGEELLGQIIGKVIERCRDPKRGVPAAEEARLYPASFMAKIREMVEREGVSEAQD